MHYKFLKEKASFMSLVIICAVFSIYLINPVLADDTSGGGENLGCCERTTSGESCRYTDVDGCDSDFKVGEFQRCEDTSFCKVGCCVSPEGSCSKQVSKSTCESAGREYFWDPNADCSLPRCEKGCCVLGGAECSLSTEKKCSELTSRFEGLEFDFRSSINNEPDCTAVCKQQDDGCCVRDDGSCTKTTRGMCGLSDGSGSTGFYKDAFCSNDALNRLCDPDCVLHAGGRHCVEGLEDVYWFDSCGNREEVVKGDDSIPWSDNLARDGDCDYATGTLCSEKTDSEHESAYCKNLNCRKSDLETEEYANNHYTTFDGLSDDAFARYNGESWCVYDSRPEPGLSTVGSRQWRHICVNGEETVEPCKDYREEFCFQAKIPDIPGREPSSGAYPESYTESSCIENKADICTDTCNTAIDEDEDVAKRAAYRNDKKCCGNNAAQCVWLNQGGTDDAPRGMCLPRVSLGGKFWTNENAEQNSAIKEKCDTADVPEDDCNTYWEKLVPGPAGEWECKDKCECYSNDAFANKNKLCNSVGDCGAFYNYKGEWTTEGFYRDWGLKDPELQDGQNPWREVKDPGDFEGGERYRYIDTAEQGLGITLNWRDVGALGNTYMDAWTDTTWGLTGAFTIPAALTIVTMTIIGAAVTDASITFGSLGGVLGTLGTATQATVGGEVIEGMFQIAAPTAGEGAAGGAAGASSWVAPIVASVLFIAALAEGDKNLMTQAAVAGLGGGLLGPLLAILMGGVALGPGGWIASAIAVIIGIIASIFSALSESENRMVSINCEPWQAPLNVGEDVCKQCDEDPFMHPCSEYRCRSLGQNCAFIPENEGTDKGTCYAKSETDIGKPVINAMPDDSRPIHVWVRESGERKDKRETYTLNPVPPGEGVERGYEILKADPVDPGNNKVKSFSSIEFGIKTENKLSQCKYSTTFNRESTFNTMENWFGNNYFTREHNMTIYGLLPNKTYEYYIICRGVNGYPKENEITPVYKISFETDDGPDLEPPYVYATIPETGSYVSAGINQTYIEAYLDESTWTRCKYSSSDVDYYLMDNYIGCAGHGESIFAPYMKCNAELNLTRGTNTFYIRCADNQETDPDSRSPEINIMDESYALTLTQSEPLLINNILPPAGAVYYTADVTLQVLTEKGAFGGRARCSYTNAMSGYGDEFSATNSTEHQQPLLGLPRGNYRYLISCFDDAGNEVTGETNFSIQADLAAPNVVALYKDASGLHLVLDEKASCEYSPSAFSFGEGTEASSDSETAVFPSGSREYHIRCMDAFGNVMPEIVVRAEI